MGVVCADDNTTTGDYNYTTNIPKHVSDDWASTISVSEMPGDSRGNISISVDEKEEYNREVSLGGNFLIINELNLDYGVHNASIKYTGDDKYKGFALNGSFEKSFLYVDIGEEVYFEGNDAPIFYIMMENGVTGNIKVKIDNKQVLNKKCGGETAVDVYCKGISFGKHTYEIIYTGGNRPDIVKKGEFSLTYRFDVSLFNEGRIFVGDDVEFLVLFRDGDLSYEVSFNGKKYKCSDDIVKFSDFNVGENVVVFSATYNSLKKTIPVKIFVEPRLVVPEKFYYSADNNITLYAAESSECDLSVKIDGADYKTEKISNAKATISVNDLSIGKHTLTINSDILNETNYTIDVVPYLSDKVWANGLKNLTFRTYENFTGSLEASGLINGNFTVENGTATLPVSGIGEGKYNLQISCGNDTWDYIVTVYAESPDWNMQLECPEKINKYAWMEEWETQYYPINILNIPNFLKNNITLYHDGERQGRYYESMEFSPKFKEMGYHNLTMVYPGDDYFNAVNKTIRYLITDTVSLDFIDKDFYIVLPYDATGTITVKVDGKKIKTLKLKVDEEAEYGLAYHYVPLDAYKFNKNYAFEVTYSGNYGKCTVKETRKLDYELKIYEPYNLIYGEDESIEFRIPYDIKNKATVTIDGVKSKYTKYYSDCYVKLPELKPGNHTIVVSYPGDSIYYAKAVNLTFTIGTRIIQEYESFSINAKRNVSLTLPADATGKLIVDINNGTYKAEPLKNGYACIQIPTDKVGWCSYTAYYEGNYDVQNVSDRFFVEPTIKISGKIVKNTCKITVNLGEGIKAKLIVFAENIPLVEYDLNSTNNVIKLDESFFNKTKSIAVANSKSWMWSLDSVTLDCQATVYVSNQSAGSRVWYEYYDAKLEASDVSAKYGSLYEIKGYDVCGDPLREGSIITVKIGAGKYKLKTDGSGVASLKLNQTPGKYNVKITYGDLTVTKKITIKHILTLKKVKVKKSAKKLVLTAELAKKLKGKKITFKFNGKKYTAKTNKKGVAKVTIKKSVLKKLKVGKKVKYQAKYLNDVVEYSIKVKR